MWDSLLLDELVRAVAERLDGERGRLARRLYTTRETADLLSVSERTVRYMLDRGELRSVTIGRARRITAESIEALLENRGAK